MTNVTFTNSSKSLIVDSYSESNISFHVDYLSSADATKVGQAFVNSSVHTLTSCKFYLKKIGAISGNAVAKLYAVSGTLGVNAVPTGSALATSDNFGVSAITSSYQLLSFTFSGANQYAMQPTNYFITLEYSGGSNGNAIDMGGGSANPPTGNAAEYFGSWSTLGGSADYCIFYVYTNGVNMNQSTKHSVSFTNKNKS